MTPKLVYYDHAAPAQPQRGYRSGKAGFVVLDPDGVAETRPRVAITPNSLHALEGHGVLGALNALPLVTGPITAGRDAVLRATGLSRASRILYEADRTTYGATHEFVVGREDDPVPVEYRILIDNREYQRTLARLQYLVTIAGREGHGVWIRLSPAPAATK